MKPTPLVVLVMGVVAGAACAGSSSGFDRSALLLSSAPPPEGRTCYATAAPATLPPVDALVDSAALLARFQSLGDGPTASALLSVRFDERGVPSARVLEGNLPAEHREGFARLALTALKPEPAAPPWSVRLKVTSDSSPRVRVGRSELCPAIPVGTLDVVVSRREVTSSGVPPAAPPTRSTPHFSILVDSNGQLVDIRLKQSSGESDVDQQLENGLRQKTFRPTLLDGAPILAWTEWPVR